MRRNTGQSRFGQERGRPKARAAINRPGRQGEAEVNSTCEGRIPASPLRIRAYMRDAGIDGLKGIR